MLNFALTRCQFTLPNHGRCNVRVLKAKSPAIALMRILKHFVRAANKSCAISGQNYDIQLIRHSSSSRVINPRRAPPYCFKATISSKRYWLPQNLFFSDYKRSPNTFIMAIALCAGSLFWVQRKWSHAIWALFEHLRATNEVFYAYIPRKTAQRVSIWPDQMINFRVMTSKLSCGTLTGPQKGQNTCLYLYKTVENPLCLWPPWQCPSPNCKVTPTSLEELPNRSTAG